ncbi:MAG TPA: YceI family protein [Gemmatimonadales bacterium]|jgi:polyisoprenoid-binding protein YceI|nr:YceI family protein [Gemmatimonadales bacterium]
MRARLAGMGAVGLAALLAGAPAATAQVASQTSLGRTSPDAKWVVDMVHSQVDFGVRHLVGRVRGTFEKWYAVLTTNEDDWRQGAVKVSVQTASLNTGNAYRDADLRSERFFDVRRYPKMTFEGTEFSVADSTLSVSGILTIKGHSKPITLTGQYRGVAKDGEGHERIAFEATGEVDRRDFGINYNESVAGTDLVGNTVEITVGIEAVRVR